MYVCCPSQDQAPTLERILAKQEELLVFHMAVSYSKKLTQVEANSSHKVLAHIRHSSTSHNTDHSSMGSLADHKLIAHSFSTIDHHISKSLHFDNQMELHLEED